MFHCLAASVADMNSQQVRDIAEAAFKTRFCDIGIVNVKPGFDHYDAPLVNVKIIYDAAYEDLNIEGIMSVRSELVDKVWRDVRDSPGYPFVHFIAKSDIGQSDPATV